MSLGDIDTYHLMQFFSRDTWLYSTKYSNHSLFDIIRNVACEYPKVLIYILYRSRLKTVSRPVGGATASISDETVEFCRGAA